MSESLIPFDDLVRLCDNKLGEHDVPCPLCGPSRERAGTDKRTVLKIWFNQPDFLTFKCIRCDEKGFALRDNNSSGPHPVLVAKAKLEVQKRDADDELKRRRTALWLWERSRDAKNSFVETYFRSRGIKVSPPATIRFLPGDNRNPWPTMVAAFGLAEEPEAGQRRDAICGVHLTYLSQDGSGKAPIDPAKRMIGKSKGWPIVLAPPNDSLGLAISEGIENALSVHEATGLGAWAAGAAGRLSDLAHKVPDYIEAVTIVTDDDPAGRKGAQELAARLAPRNFEIFFMSAGN